MKNKLGFDHFDEKYFLDRRQRFFLRKNHMIEVAQNRGNRLYHFYLKIKEWIIFEYIDDETNLLKLKEIFFLGSQVLYGHIKTLESFGQTVSLVIDSKEVTLINESHSYNNVFEMLEAYTVATICRNAEVINLLFSQKKSGNILRNGIHQRHPASRAYYLFKNEDEVTEEKFQEFYAALIDNVKQKDMKKYREQLMMPLGEVYRAYFFGDAVLFNQNIKKALDLNKLYYDTEKDDRCRDIVNWLPWNLISMACKAYDKGWKITVEDTRLPMFLVRGECNVSELPKVIDEA